MNHRLLTSLLFAGLIIAAGCASSGQTARGDSRVLLPEEIAAAPVINMYEAIERLRPRWLAGSLELAVFYNGRYAGGVETLREYRTDGIARARFLTAAEAAATLPIYDTIRRSSGAIVLEPADGGEFGFR
jgi:hypothetical protein